MYEGRKTAVKRRSMIKMVTVKLTMKQHRRVDLHVLLGLRRNALDLLWRLEVLVGRRSLDLKGFKRERKVFTGFVMRLLS